VTLIGHPRLQTSQGMSLIKPSDCEACKYCILQDLVGKTFFELWFEEPVGHHTQFLGDGSAVPLDITEKVQQLVDVLRRLPGHQPMVTIIKRSLALDFCPQNTKNTATSMMTQAAVRHRCELMCKCLLESVLKVCGMLDLSCIISCTCHNCREEAGSSNQMACV
jgi:hypothetical protein